MQRVKFLPISPSVFSATQPKDNIFRDGTMGVVCGCLGTSGSGKTSLFAQRFDPHSGPTIGVDFVCMNYTSSKNPTIVGRLCIIDFQTQERAQSFHSYIRNVGCVIITYDVSNPQGEDEPFGQLNNITNAIRRVNEFKMGLKCIIVGTKYDILSRMNDEDENKVECYKGIQAVQDIAAQHGYPFIMTSSRTGDGIGDLYDALLETVMDINGDYDGAIEQHYDTDHEISPNNNQNKNTQRDGFCNLM